MFVFLLYIFKFVFRFSSLVSFVLFVDAACLDSSFGDAGVDQPLHGPKALGCFLGTSKCHKCTTEGAILLVVQHVCLMRGLDPVRGHAEIKFLIGSRVYGSWFRVWGLGMHRDPCAAGRNSAAPERPCTCQCSAVEQPCCCKADCPMQKALNLGEM